MTVFYGKRPQPKGIGSRIKVITPVSYIPFILDTLAASGDITFKTFTDNVYDDEQDRNLVPLPLPASLPESIKKKV